MRIQITDVLFDEETGLTMVEFSNPFGVGVGEWRGEAPPERYNHYHVEIETANRLTWGQDIVLVSDEHFVIDYDLNQLVTLQGKLESIQPDGVAYILIGAVLVTVKTSGDPLPLDSFVRVHADRINLYPYEP
ncbi:MAG: hypothetical protein HND44_06655 [Chloroflexi bacterium]|nr:hypothetical protein [Ardenticatenaceae bacterium]MBL1128170.1 hypothetical protein [Chloroflexota bacterium]NOG34243.1 hypothetical protein [Chloroflexota bacterium]GIK56357.1 MAG: hypothetical protein BroJett015_20200 [Chloroflexota bacterium]